MEEFIDPIDDGKAVPSLEVYSPKEVLEKGLRLMYSEKRVLRVTGSAYSSKTNLQRFKAHYGAGPGVVAKIWADLQRTTVPRARIIALNFDMFLMALNFLYRYQRESEREGPDSTNLQKPSESGRGTT